MAEGGVTGACTPAVSDPGANLFNGEMGLDEAQAAALEHTCERRKDDDVTRGMMEGAAQKAVDNVMSQFQSQQQLLIDSTNGSVEKAVSNAVGGLTSELHNRMRLWEGQMETQVKSQTQQHWDIFVYPSKQL